MLRGSTHYCAIAPRALSRHIVDFLGYRQMETAPTSIEVLLRPTLVQSDEPSDFKWFSRPHDTTSLHACPSVYSTWCVPDGHPSNYELGRRCLTSVIEPTLMS